MDGACPICRDGFAEGGGAAQHCDACHAPFHVECWEWNGGCGVYGCARAPQTVKSEGVEAETRWGQTWKVCQGCGGTIRVAAQRCRHCGAVFDAADTAGARAQDLARVKSSAVIVFVCGLAPPTAPLALLLGLVWYRANRALLARLPGTHRVLSQVGLVAAALSTAAFGLALLLGE